MVFGVVVVTCNRLNLLKECVEAIEGQTVKITKKVFVNNKSSDGTKEYLDGLKEELGLTVIHSTENLGGAGGYYTALKQMEKENVDWILIIDDDAIIRKDFIESIAKAIENNEDKYLAYSGVVIEDGEPSIFHRKIILPGNIIGKAIPNESYEKDSFVCDVASFCGLVIHKSILDRCGLPKKEFFIWHDDTEYCLRIHQESQILNINSAKLDHKRKPGASDIHDWKNYYGLRNALYIYKNYSPKQYYKELLKLVIKLIKSYKAKDIVLQRIYSAVLLSNFKKELGKNENFLPGKKIL